MMKHHILSKSTFMYGCQCPLRLYYYKFKPELRNPEDEEQQAIFTTGTNVGVMAQGVFPGGIDVTPPDPFSYHISVAKTQELIAQGVKVIYEAAFNYDGIMCAVDLLVKKNNKWYAYEVKSVNNLKPQHIMDSALQYYVLTNTGLPLADFSLMHFDKEYVRRGDIDVKKLFKATSILEEVKEQQNFIRDKAAELKELLRTKTVPIIEPGDQCFEPYECDFTLLCWKNIPEEEDTTDYGELDINKPAIEEFLTQLKYPIYYFDFETVMPAVPLYDESRPYQQIPFQYSLHIQKSKNAPIEHKAYLGDGINEPRESLIKTLLKDIGTAGTVLTWNKSFENTRIKELARDFPKYSQALLAILDRVEDLMLPFKRKHYHHPEFEGSASIKNVLPVLVPELSYESLEIQNGGMATTIYANLKEQDQETYAKQRQALLEYCHLDTLAMVKILEKLNRI